MLLTMNYERIPRTTVLAVIDDEQVIRFLDRNLRPYVDELLLAFEQKEAERLLDENDVKY